jgi:carboxypeptidase Taq
MKTAQANYERLHELSKKIRILEGISSLLEWDQETHMPKGASAIRSEQLSSLAGIIHTMKTAKPFANALEKLINLKTGKVVAKGLKTEQQAALREWRRNYLLATALPNAFVEEFVQLCSQSMEAWKSARKQNSFQQFAPYLDKLITMSRKKADLLGYDDHPYDAMLDLYEPESTTKELTSLFSRVQKSITDLVKKITKAKQIDNSFLFGNFSHAKQVEFGNEILNAMGYDMQYGRLDFSTHPFSSSAHPTDSRITTRIHPESLLSNILIVLHEGGHSLYEMGIPQDQYGSPLGESVSMAVHESQSRWWETRIGLSKPFWNHFFPRLKKAFAPQLNKVTEEQFFRAINQVKPSFIRVEADEVTYPLHVILRFELEKDLFSGALKVREIPEAWNEKMTNYLGITPKTNTEGCLQDVHWSMGAFGYFPTYALGNMYAAHLFQKFVQDYPDWEKQVAKGELLFIKKWLNEAIHQHGKHYRSQELLKKITGKPFTEKAYVDYLNSKYTEIYKLKR